VRSAERARREPARFVIAIVAARAPRASRSTAATSGAAPDCEMPITPPRPNAGGD
jgi:hypothetical protein